MIPQNQLSLAFLMLSSILLIHLSPPTWAGKPTSRQLEPDTNCVSQEERQRCQQQAKTRWRFEAEGGGDPTAQTRCCCHWDAVKCFVQHYQRKCPGQAVRYQESWKEAGRMSNFTLGYGNGPVCDNTKTSCGEYLMMDSPGCQTSASLVESAGLSRFWWLVFGWIAGFVSAVTLVFVVIFLISKNQDSSPTAPTEAGAAYSSQ